MVVKKGGCAKLIIQIYNVNFVDSNYFKGNVTIVGRFVNENIKVKLRVYVDFVIGYIWSIFFLFFQNFSRYYFRFLK